MDDSMKMSLGEIDCDVMNYPRSYMGFFVDSDELSLCSTFFNS